MLAINSESNMPYDLCEDIPSLDVIESEMTKRGKLPFFVLFIFVFFMNFNSLANNLYDYLAN